MMEDQRSPRKVRKQSTNIHRFIREREISKTDALQSYCVAHTLALSTYCDTQRKNYTMRKQLCSPFSRSTLVLLLTATAATIQSASALVVTLPGSHTTNGWSVDDRQTRSNIEVAEKSARVRVTRKHDVQRISSLLAAASVGQEGTGPLNWKVKMDILRAEATYSKQLSLRIDALEAGKTASAKARKIIHEDCGIEDGTTSSSDGIRLIWSDDAFRAKLERAVSNIEAERHLWHGHNFAFAPDDASILQHLMLSAVDVNTGQIAGFCEVAMLPLPDSSAKQYGKYYGPMIANLVTSPEYRRRGIASSLLKTSKRYVRSCWGSCDEIGLYVEKDNTGAKALYSREGFVQGGVCSHIPSRLYLQKSLALA